MMQQNLVIPAVCRNCGELFDMSYDMKKNAIDNELDAELERKTSQKSSRKKLCWECRVM